MSANINLLRLANQFIEKNPLLDADIESALKDISDNPFVDAETKFYYSVPPNVITLYKKDSLWVLYSTNDACTKVTVWNIGKHGDKITFR